MGSTQIEVKYYNSFWLKKVVKNGDTDPSWPGLPWDPTGYSTIPFPFGAASVAGTPKTGAVHWYVEESRIKGGFNNITVDFAVRAYAVEKNKNQSLRASSLIYSGIYNSLNSFNRTNVFSVGDNLITEINPADGSVQKLHAENTNLIVFQENKVSKALINKTTVYSGDQGSNEKSGKGKNPTTAPVIGQIVPYLGEYGISKNPESFAVYGYRKYFADKNRSAILRLSRDGITEISRYGMRDYFRDYLSSISDDWQVNIIRAQVNQEAVEDEASFVFSTGNDCCKIKIGSAIFRQDGGSGPYEDTGISVVNVTGCGGTPTITLDQNVTWADEDKFYIVNYVKGRIPGAWDIHQQCYSLSLQNFPRYYNYDQTVSGEEADTYTTTTFDESILGWTSFYTFKPMFMDSLKDKFYSLINSNIYEHYDQSVQNNRGEFYETQSDASITFIFNPNPSVNKNFNTVGYEGSNGWEVDSFLGDLEGMDDISGGWVEKQDKANSVKSYVEGQYDGSGNLYPAALTPPIYRAGFDRKENKYVTNLISASTPRPGEVIWGNKMSGVKGYFATVKLSTDANTDYGGMKELYAVSSNYVVSSY